MNSQKRQMFGSFTSLKPDLPSDPARGRNRITSETRLMFYWVCFLWFCSGFCWIIFMCYSFQSHGAILTFRGQDFLADYESQSYILIICESFFPFFFLLKSYFRTCPCGLARGITVTHGIWLFQSIGAGFLSELLYLPEHESRLRKWSFSCCIFTSFFLLVLKWTKELFILS